MSEANVDPEIERFREHQANAAKLPFADECRTLVELGRYAVLSTFGREHGGGYPAGSIVGFASDDRGRPIFTLSTMSGHTGDLAANGKCALTVTAPGFTGAADARVTLTGEITPVTDPVYAPNSYGGPQADPSRTDDGGTWYSDGEMVRTAYTLRAEDDDWSQAGKMVREVWDDDERARFVENVSGHLADGVSEPILLRAFEYWRNVDKNIGDRIEQAVRNGG